MKKGEPQKHRFQPENMVQRQKHQVLDLPPIGTNQIGVFFDHGFHVQQLCRNRFPVETADLPPQGGAAGG